MWHTTPDGKQPNYFTAADGAVLSIAGLWSEWHDQVNNETIASCTLIITEANSFVSTVHDRMPVLLDRASFEPWLSGEAGTELLKPAPDDALQKWPVSRRMNKAGVNGDDQTLIDRLTH